MLGSRTPPPLPPQGRISFPHYPPVSTTSPATNFCRLLSTEGARPLQGVRTFIANNNPVDDAQVESGRQYNETWSYYPDDVPLRSLYGGDSRAALVPFLAHTQLKDTYKWLLYGDDDTVWFLEGVMSMLEDLDPDMPYFITGKHASQPCHAIRVRQGPKCCEGCPQGASSVEGAMS